MAFTDFPQQGDVVALLQRSLEAGRLAHAYLFTGGEGQALEGVARTLAKTLNCERPQRRRPDGPALDCCDACSSCRKVQSDNHPDVHWTRPESKLRQIKVDQIRELMHAVQLKPTQARYKVAVLVDADRLNLQAANAFLKTLEEPPPASVLILLSTEPQRLLETVLSRCLRLTFAGESGPPRDPALQAWLTSFSETAVVERGSVLSRYRLLSVLLSRLSALREQTTELVKERSPLQQYEDVEPELREKWEEELAAGVEAEYRRQRATVLTALHWWLRDVWLSTLGQGRERLAFPALAAAAETIAARLSPAQALENLHVLEETQRLLATNVQEALALEVALLKLNL